MLPNMDGFEVCRILTKDHDIPIMFVTAKNENIDKLKGLGMGASDYIVKPFEPSELVARVGAHIRRYELLTQSARKENEKIIIGDLTIEVKSRRVYLGNEEICFPNKEFDLLLFLAKNSNVVFSKQELLDNVWGIDSLNPKYIETLWGVGYRFISN